MQISHQSCCGTPWPFYAPGLTARQARQPMRQHAPRPGRSSITEANSAWHPDDDDASHHPRRRRLGALVPAPLMGSGTLGPLRWSAPYGSDTRHDATTRLSDPNRKRPLIDWTALLTCGKPQEQGSRQAFCCASEKQQRPGSAKHTIQESPLRKDHHWSQGQAQHSTAQQHAAPQQPQRR